MTWIRELFRFGAPLLNDTDAAKLARKRELARRIEACRSRWESAELLSGGSPADALVLCRQLHDDLVHAFTALSSDDSPLGSPIAEPSIEAVADGATAKRLRGLGEKIGPSVADRPARDDIAEIVREMRRVLDQLGREFRALERSRLATPMDAYRRRVWIQISIATIVVMASGGTALALRSTRRERAQAEFDRLFTRGHVMIRGKDFAGALEKFRQAVAVLPDNPRAADAYNNTGWALDRLGRYDEAIAAYEAALRLKPAHVRARNNLKSAKRHVNERSN